MANFEQGKTYEFVSNNGVVFTARFDGFGEFMSLVWTNPVDGLRIHPLPPYQSYRKID